MDINRIDAYLQGASLDGYQEFGAHFMNTTRMAHGLRSMRRMPRGSC